MKTRIATQNDIDMLVKVRFDYFAAEDWPVSPEQHEEIEDNLRRYYLQNLNVSFVAVFAEVDEELASVAFLAISEMPANLSFPTGKKGTILNVLTYPLYRRNGYATSVLNVLIREAKERKLSYIELSASKSGEPLYRSLGFGEVIRREGFSDMRLSLL